MRSSVNVLKKSSLINQVKEIGDELILVILGEIFSDSYFGLSDYEICFFDDRSGKLSESFSACGLRD